jgi:hypothetical protein
MRDRSIGNFRGNVKFSESVRESEVDCGLHLDRGSDPVRGGLKFVFGKRIP